MCAQRQGQHRGAARARLRLRDGPPRRGGAAAADGDKTARARGRAAPVHRRQLSPSELQLHYHMPPGTTVWDPLILRSFGTRVLGCIGVYRGVSDDAIHWTRGVSRLERQRNKPAAVYFTAGHIAKYTSRGVFPN